MVVPPWLRTSSHRTFFDNWPKLVSQHRQPSYNRNPMDYIVAAGGTVNCVGCISKNAPRLSVLMDRRGKYARILRVTVLMPSTIWSVCDAMKKLKQKRILERRTTLDWEWTTICPVVKLETVQINLIHMFIIADRNTQIVENRGSKFMHFSRWKTRTYYPRMKSIYTDLVWTHSTGRSNTTFGHIQLTEVIQRNYWQPQQQRTLLLLRIHAYSFLYR